MSELVIPVPEKLRVFISSSIRECPEERAIARKSVQSINHEPVLFEHAGARPYSSRDWYLRKVTEANIFVGIYRNSYGYVAPDMKISGLEDEYRLAQERGMPCLFYVNSDDSQRDPQLRNLMEDMKGRTKICFYKDPTDLFGRLRDDLTAVVSETFYRAERLEVSLRASARDELKQIIPTGTSLIVRSAVQKMVLSALDLGSAVQVVGPKGIGKTVLLANLAEENRFIFVPASGLRRKELAEILVNRLRQSTSGDIQYFIDSDGAFSSLVRVWKVTPAFTIVLDDCLDRNFISDLLGAVGGVDSSRRLIYSGRVPSESLGHSTVTIPPFTVEEVKQFVVANIGETTSDSEMNGIVEASQGNPLFLRYYLASPTREIHKTLAEFESALWNSVEPRGREIIECLCIANVPLSVDDLNILLSGAETPTDEVLKELEKVHFFVRYDSIGYSVVNDHLRETVMNGLQSHPHRHSYYARRVASVLQKRRDYMEAYFALDSAREYDQARQIAAAAQFDAAVSGDQRGLAQILESSLAHFRDQNNVERTVLDLLTLYQAKQHLGDLPGAINALGEARILAGASGNESLLLKTREAVAVHDMSRYLTPQSLADLVDLKVTYKQRGDEWSSARVALDLGTAFMRLDRLAEAKTESEYALEVFQRTDDEYGISLARRNLISALSGIPGKEQEASELLKELEGKSESSTNLRERAWLCNVLTRKFRRAREYEKAKAYASEAIDIGVKLGDSTLVAVNRSNLGNVFRDQGLLDEAVKEYMTAATEAQKVGDRALEASNTRKTASLYNRIGKPDLAKQYALYAVSLVRNTLATDELASCLEELGDACGSLGEEKEAANFYIEGAASLMSRKETSEALRLGLKGLSILTEEKATDDYLKGIGLIWKESIGGIVQGKGSVGERLFEAFKILLNLVDRDYAIPLFGLHFYHMFADVPPLVGRYLFRVASKALLEEAKGTQESWRALFPFIPLLVSLPVGSPNLEDLAEVGDRLHEGISDIHFKPYDDGSGHWVLYLNIGRSVVCSISTLDGRVDSSVAALLIAVFLKGFEKEIEAELFSSTAAARSEIAIEVANIESAPPAIRSYVSPILSHQACAITRATDPKSSDQVPVFVFCRDSIQGEWRLEPGKGSALHLLLGLTLVEVVFQLLNGEIETAVLEPKIVNLVRKIV